MNATALTIQENGRRGGLTAARRLKKKLKSKRARSEYMRSLVRKRWPEGRVIYRAKTTAEIQAERPCPTILEEKDRAFDFKAYCAVHGAGPAGTILSFVRSAAEIEKSWRDAKGIARRRHRLYVPPSSRGA